MLSFLYGDIETEQLKSIIYIKFYNVIINESRFATILECWIECTDDMDRPRNQLLFSYRYSTNVITYNISTIKTVVKIVNVLQLLQLVNNTITGQSISQLLISIDHFIDYSNVQNLLLAINYPFNVMCSRHNRHLVLFN